MLTKVLVHQLRRPAGLLGRMVARVMEYTNKAAYRDALGVVDWAAARHVFEVGYGPGDGLALVRKATPTARLSGIDFSPLMYERARARLGSSVELACGDFLAAALPPDTYSHVLCVNVVYFWPGLSAPFQKVWGMLAPGGALVLFMRDEAYLEKKKLLDSGAFHRHAPVAVERALREVGFAVTRSESREGVVFRAEKPSASPR